MQRRAAAAYFAFFLVVSVAAYAYIGVAESQRPEVTLEGEELTNDSTFTVDGTTHTVSNIHRTGGDGHGGGGEMVADLSWTNDSSRYTATLEADSTATVDDTTYVVTVDNESSTATLTEEQNVTALLRADPSVENSLATQNGTEYVVSSEDGTLEPVSEWLPEPETRSYGVGDSFAYQTGDGTQETTVASVSESGMTVEWFAPEEKTAELTEGGNVTLQGQQYFAHFPDEQSVQLVSTDQYGAYQATLGDQDYFHERTNGLWGISILSGIAATLMLGMAYLPNRG